MASLKKGLIDTGCDIELSFCFTHKYKAIWKENLAVNQTSLRGFFSTHSFNYYDLSMLSREGGEFRALTVEALHDVLYLPEPFTV